MNYNRIKSLAKERKVSIKRLAEQYAEMSEVGFHQAIRNDTLTIRVLELIAKKFEVSMCYFFDDSYEITSLSGVEDVRKLQEEIIRLQRELIEEKERNILLLKKMSQQ